MSLVDPCNTNVKMYSAYHYLLVRGTPPHVSWREPKGRGDTRWKSSMDCPVRLAGKLSQPSMDCPGFTLAGKVIREYIVTPAVHGLSRDGGVILAGKVICEYIVTPAVHGLSRDGGVILAGKVICEYIVTPAVHGLSRDCPEMEGLHLLEKLSVNTL